MNLFDAPAGERTSPLLKIVGHQVSFAALRLDVANIVLVNAGDDRHDFRHGLAVILQLRALVRIVGQEASAAGRNKK